MKNKDKKWFLKIIGIAIIAILLLIILIIGIRNYVIKHKVENQVEDTNIPKENINDYIQDDIDIETGEVIEENLTAKKIVTNDLGCSLNNENNGACVTCSGTDCNEKKYICYCCSEGYIYDGGNICVKR